MKQHPLSAAFPAMAADEYQALVDSVTNNGVINPITTYEGMVLDGWHRYSAANEVGVECPMVELDGVDPQAFVIAQNKDRRHIAQGQIALAVAAVYRWKPRGANQHGASAPGADPAKTTAQLAEIAGVGERTMERAKTVEAKATPKVKEAVKAGEISVKRAAEIAQLPAKEQAKALTAPPPKEVPADREDEMAHTITELAEENEQLRDRLAVGVMAGTEEEKNEAAQIIADLRQQVATLEAEAVALRSSRDHYQREASELRKQIKMNDREHERELRKARAIA